MRLPEIVDEKTEPKTDETKKNWTTIAKQWDEDEDASNEKIFLFRDPKNNCNLKIVKSLILMDYLSSFTFPVFRWCCCGISSLHHAIISPWQYLKKKKREQEEFQNKCCASVCPIQPKEDTKRKQKKETKLLSLVTRTFKTLSFAILRSISEILSAQHHCVHNVEYTLHKPIAKSGTRKKTRGETQCSDQCGWLAIQK